MEVDDVDPTHGRTVKMIRDPSCWDRRRPRLPVPSLTRKIALEPLVEMELVLVYGRRWGRLRSQHDDF